MSVTLQSKGFTRAPQVRERLNKCANDHAFNIFQGNGGQGDHVSQIQAALVGILGTGHGISERELENGIYGETTATAVQQFKSSPQLNGTGKPILGPGQIKPDQIVGKQTILALDRVMLRLQPGPFVPPTPPPEPPEEPKLAQDIFVYFRGAPPEFQGMSDLLVNREFPRTFNTEAYLKTHKSVIVIAFFGGRGATDKSNDVIRQVDLLRSSNKNGITIIRGDSIGGLNALTTASALSIRGHSLAYVAIDDAAFFPPGEIASFEPLAFNAPTNINAGIKENYFQKFGHEILRDEDQPNGFLPGTEFHGELPGFRSIPVEGKSTTAAVIASFNRVSPSLRFRREKFRFAAKAHVAAHIDADPLIDNVVKMLMTAAPAPPATP